MEQSSNYDLLLSKTDNFRERFLSLHWDGLTEPERRALNSVSIYFCPSRRSITTPYGDSGGRSQSGNEPHFGPQSDYAFVYGPRLNTWTTWTRAPIENVGDIPGVGAVAAGTYETVPSDFSGPFWVANQTGSDASTWTPAYTMTLWADGTSNQIVVGEKYIPRSYYSVCNNSLTDPPPDAQSGWERTKYGDCSILTFGWLYTFAPARSFRGGIARDLDDRRNLLNDTGGTPTPHWGGLHPVVTNFLFGDGAVRGISNTIPTGNSRNHGDSSTDRLLAQLGFVDDGRAVTLP